MKRTDHWAELGADQRADQPVILGYELFWGILFLITGCLQSCGKPAQKDPHLVFPQSLAGKELAVDAPKVEPTKTSGPRFELVLESSKNASFPDPGRPYVAQLGERGGLPYDQEWAMTDQEAIYKKVIQVKENERGELGPLFLTWHQDAFGARMTDGRFMHQKINAQDKTLGPSDRYNIGYDPESGYWFIPLIEALVKRPSDGDPTDLHWLTLDLELQGGTRKMIYIGLRVMVPPPKIQILKQEIQQEPLHGERALIHKEVWLNPSFRKVRAWINIDSSLQALTGLRQAIYEGRPFSAPVGPTWHPYYSKAEWGLDRLRVSSSERESREIEIHPGWFFIDMGPNEKLTLEWLISGQNQKKCTLPTPASQEFHWQEYKWTYDLDSRGVLVPKLIAEGHSAQRTLYWEFSGSQLKGRWLRRMKLSDPYVPREMIQQDQGSSRPGEDFSRIKTLEDENHNIDALWGEKSEASEAFECQGIFTQILDFYSRIWV